MESIKSLQNKPLCNDEIPIVGLIRFIWRYKIHIILFVVFVTVAAGLYEAFRPSKYIARSCAEISIPLTLNRLSNPISSITLDTVNLMVRSTSFHKELEKSLQMNQYQLNIPKIFNIKYLPSRERLVIQVESQERETAEKLLRIWLGTFKRYTRQLKIEVTIPQIQDEIDKLEVALSGADLSLHTISAKKQQLDPANKVYDQYYLQVLLSLELQKELEKQQKKKLLENKKLLTNILNSFIQTSSNSLSSSTLDNKIISDAHSIIEQRLPVEFTEIELIQQPRRIVVISLLAFILSSGGICIVMMGIFGLVSQKTNV